MSAPCLAGGTSARKTRTGLGPGRVLASWIELPIDAHEFNQTARAPDAPTLPSFAPGHDRDVPCVLPVVMQSRRGGMGPRRDDFRAKCHGGDGARTTGGKLSPSRAAHLCARLRTTGLCICPHCPQPRAACPHLRRGQIYLCKSITYVSFSSCPHCPHRFGCHPGGSAVARRRRSTLERHWRGWVASRLAHASMAGARCVLSYHAPGGGVQISVPPRP